jgi:hypothetical protein
MALTGRLISDEQIAPADIHARILAAADRGQGEFTGDVAEEISALGIAPNASLYRDDSSFRVVKVGTGVTFLTATDRDRSVGNPVRSIPCLPSLTSVLEARLEAAVKTGRSAAYGVKAIIGGHEATWDRIVIPFPKSGLVGAFCVLGGVRAA